MTTNNMTNKQQIRIENIDNYVMEVIDGVLFLNHKENYITECELNMTDLKGSKIITCIIKDKNEIISTCTSYVGICKDIWKSMPTQKILQTTLFNFKLTNENGERGYNWYQDINMSFQNKDSMATMREIVNMVKVNNIDIDITIKLQTGSTIHFRN